MDTDAKESMGQAARPGAAASPHLIYVPREDATPERETASLAAVYAFILERYEQKQIAAESATDASTTSVERLNESGEGTPTGEGSF